MSDTLLDKQEAEQAPPVTSPTYVDNAVGTVRQDQEKARETMAEQKAKVLAMGSETEFWYILKELIQKVITDMRKAESTRMGQGALDLQAIGLRSVVINEIADAFEQIIGTVEFRKRKAALETAMGTEDTEDRETVGIE